MPCLPLREAVECAIHASAVARRYLEQDHLGRTKPHVPTTLQAARELFAESAVAREAFGQEVVDHYLNRARIELDAFEAAVTDWEKFRGFERL